MLNYFYTSVDLRYNKILVRGYSNNKPFAEEVEYSPFVFIPDKTGEYRTLRGDPLKKKIFNDIQAARNFERENAGVSNFNFYGSTNWLYQFIHEEFPRNGKISYNPDNIKIVYIDIEVDHTDGFPNIKKADREITAISMKLNGRTLVFGCKYYKSKSPDVIYVLCQNEKEMLEKFLDFWNDEEWAPDVVSGWYIDDFDIPYIHNRIKKVLGDNAVKMLSPWRIINENENKFETKFEFVGIKILDYLNIYKKFTPGNEESYSLDHIAHIVVGEKKIDYSDYTSLNELYSGEFDVEMDKIVDPGSIKHLGKLRTAIKKKLDK